MGQGQYRIKKNFDNGHPTVLLYIIIKTRLLPKHDPNIFIMNNIYNFQNMLLKYHANVILSYGQVYITHNLGLEVACSSLV